MRLDIGIEQPHRRVDMRQICPLPHKLLFELGQGPSQFRLLAAQCMHDMKFGHRRSPSETPEIAMVTGRGTNRKYASRGGCYMIPIMTASARAGEYVWRRVGSFHETHSDEGAVILAIYRRPNVFQNSTGYARPHN